MPSRSPISTSKAGRRSAKSPAKRTRAARRGDGQQTGRAAKRAAKRTAKGGGRRLSFGLIAALLVIWGVIGFAAAGVWFAVGLPDTSRLLDADERGNVHVIDAEGGPIATFGGRGGDPVTVAELPPWLPGAVIAIEDRRFYEHGALDVRGIARALFVNLRSGAIREGGSTITQQLAKNLFLGPERSFHRKAQEALLALWLEQKFTKDELLTLYLNRVYLGAGTYGVDAAARRYFGKPAAKVNEAEAAMLAGLLRAPTRYAPNVNPEGAWERAQLVLAAMAETGVISPERASALQDKPPAVVRAAGGASSRYFADWVADQIPDYAGPAGRDLVVRTTLDSRLQAAAESAIAAGLADEGARRGVGQAALVAMTPDGAVRALVGGREYRASSFNRAVNAHRQPGSAFKLFVYLAALEAGMSPTTIVVDEPVRVGAWQPENNDGRFDGPMTLRDAFARSVNTVAVKVAEQVGRERVVSAAHALGILSELPRHPSMALGALEVTPLELTTAYARIAAGGRAIWPHGIVEIRDTDGAEVYRRHGSGLDPAVSADIAARLTAMLREVVVSGTGRAADPGRPAAGKTGTSQDFRDAWFVGFTADLVVGVWVGNDDNTPMRGVTGGGLPARIWRDFVVAASRGKPVRPLVVREESATGPSPAVGPADGGLRLRLPGFPEVKVEPAPPGEWKLNEGGGR